ncbi:MAG: CapA family protein [Cyclobacteriaceae bacterium]|nr:CapA family protein [Cyclobacteriaceae bacterium]
MRQFSILLLAVVVLTFSCKTQKLATTTTSKIKADTIPAIVLPNDTLIVETETPQDSVEIVAHRVLKDTILITAVGDMMLGTNYPEESYLPPNEGKYQLREVDSLLRGGDILFGNLEGTILNEGGEHKTCKNPKACYIFRSPEYMAARVKEAGFNLVSVANNHAGDFGLTGRKNTSRVLDSLQINFAGNSIKPFTIFKVDGMKYGFAAFAPNVGTPSINNLDSARKVVQHLDSLVDIVIVSFHGGAEGAKYTHVPRKNEYFYGENRGNVYKFAHTMIDAGADVLIGHGPHVPRAIEVYKNRFIVYSLGNFCTYGRFNLRGDNGLAPIVIIKINNKGEFLNGKIEPAIQKGAGTPVPDPSGKVIQLIKKLSEEDFPESQVSVDESGNIFYLHD